VTTEADSYCMLFGAERNIESSTSNSETQLLFISCLNSHVSK
jgi:hypothetical protein